VFLYPDSIRPCQVIPAIPPHYWHEAEQRHIEELPPNQKEHGKYKRAPDDKIKGNNDKCGPLVDIIGVRRKEYQKGGCTSKSRREREKQQQAPSAGRLPLAPAEGEDKAPKAETAKHPEAVHSLSLRHRTMELTHAGPEDADRACRAEVNEGGTAELRAPSGVVCSDLVRNHQLIEVSISTK
jgi:hypothetical protein